LIPKAPRNSNVLKRASIKKSKKFINLSFLDISALFDRSQISQAFTLNLNSTLVSVFCHLGEFGCGDGGWTPVMKIDGNKVLYDSIQV